MAAAEEAAAAVVSVADCGLPDSAPPPEEEGRGVSARAPARKKMNDGKLAIISSLASSEYKVRVLKRFSMGRLLLVGCVNRALLGFHATL